MTIEQLKQVTLMPPPGSALARARDYGIDLSLLWRNLTMTVEERLEKAGRALETAKELRQIRKSHRG